MSIQDFINKLYEIVKKPENLILTFKYELNSKDWDCEQGTTFDEKTTREMLIDDLQDHLRELIDSSVGLWENSNFQTVSEARYNELDKKARDDYLENFDYRHVINVLEEDEFQEYCQLYVKVYGELPEVFIDELELRAVCRECGSHED